MKNRDFIDTLNKNENEDIDLKDGDNKSYFNETWDINEKEESNNDEFGVSHNLIDLLNENDLIT